MFLAVIREELLANQNMYVSLVRTSSAVTAKHKRSPLHYTSSLLSTIWNMTLLKEEEKTYGPRAMIAIPKGKSCGRFESAIDECRIIARFACTLALGGRLKRAEPRVGLSLQRSINHL